MKIISLIVLLSSFTFKVNALDQFIVGYLYDKDFSQLEFQCHTLNKKSYKCEIVQTEIKKEVSNLVEEINRMKKTLSKKEYKERMQKALPIMCKKKSKKEINEIGQNSSNRISEICLSNIKEDKKIDKIFSVITDSMNKNCTVSSKSFNENLQLDNKRSLSGRINIDNGLCKYTHIVTLKKNGEEWDYTKTTISKDGPDRFCTKELNKPHTFKSTNPHKKNIECNSITYTRQR